MKVPIQSLIDHIKTAIDVDPWAKEMVEELLKEQGSIIKSLESDLHETLEVVSGQLNVVRCKDCKYYDGNGTCMKIGIAFLTDEWFCADGEGKDG